MNRFEDKRLNNEFMYAVLMNFEANLEQCGTLNAKYLLSRFLDALVMTGQDFDIQPCEFPWNRLRGAA